MEKLLKSLLILLVAVAGMFYTPWVLLNSYTLIAKEFNWFVPLYWQMFALVMFKNMLEVDDTMSLQQIQESVGNKESFLIKLFAKPAALTVGWFFIWLAL